MTEFLDIVLPYLVGPASGLVVTFVLLVALVWMVWWSIKNVLGPFAKQWLDDQNKRFDRLMDSHGEDRRAFHDAMQKFDSRFERVESDITDIKSDVRDLLRNK